MTVVTKEEDGTTIERRTSEGRRGFTLTRISRCGCSDHQRQRCGHPRQARLYLQHQHDAAVDAAEPAASAKQSATDPQADVID